MTDDARDSPASLYGPVSLTLGLISLIGLAVGFAGLAFTVLSGGLAATFGVLGLRGRVRRVQCAIGLATGGITVLVLITLLFLWSL
ncbi:hypothetical protein FM076_31615 [Streptomyces albus subsp. chlorinus]|nr:hypothetical protein [Streptomyces albus]NSC25456.1 hypothetical protein [Streptomyces albus subsp. chlorinus]